MEDMKRLYITGIAGMLGSNIAYLLQDRYGITGVDKVPFTAENINCEQIETEHITICSGLFNPHGSVN